MAYRQYIGARYVPKFFDNNGSTEWVSGVQYEALTIVTYLGNSYTSRKAVPSNIGAPNANPEYWASTGLYNAQVEQLRTEIDALSDTVEAMQTRKYILIGDSYALSNHGNWTQKLKDLLAPATVWRLQDSGAGFVNGEFLDLLSGWVANHSNDLNDITDIIICGGANDATSSLNSLATAMPAFSSYARNNMPNAHLWVGFIGWINRNSDVFANRTPSYQRQVLNYYCNKALHGMDYLNGISMVMHDVSLMQDDGIHPNSSGGDAIAAAAYQALMNGYVTISRYDNVENPTVPNGSWSGTWYESLSGELIVLRTTDFSIAYTSGHEVELTNSWVTLATGMVLPYSDSLGAFEIPTLIHDADDSLYKQFNLLMRVVSGNLQAKLDLSATSSTWKTITSKQLRFYANTYVFDGILATG